MIVGDFGEHFCRFSLGKTAKHRVHKIFRARAPKFCQIQFLRISTNAMSFHLNEALPERRMGLCLLSCFLLGAKKTHDMSHVAVEAQAGMSLLCFGCVEMIHCVLEALRPCGKGIYVVAQGVQSSLAICTDNEHQCISCDLTVRHAQLFVRLFSGHPSRNSFSSVVHLEHKVGNL